LYRGKFEFGTTERPGQSVSGILFVLSMRPPVVAMLFFVSVNQVLVRLWTRATNVVPAFVALLICGWAGNEQTNENGPVVRSYV
jgi:hypothetical protein